MVLLLFDPLLREGGHLLARAIDALEAWGAIDAGSREIENYHVGPVEPRRSRGRTPSHPNRATTTATVRAILARTDERGLRLNVASPIAQLHIRRRSPPVGVTRLEATFLADLDIDMHKVGRRFFEWPGESDEAAALEASREAARVAGRPHEARQLGDAIEALLARTRDERRLLFLELLRNLAVHVAPEKIWAGLDGDGYPPHQAALAWYRDASALLADFALTADWIENLAPAMFAEGEVVAPSRELAPLVGDGDVASAVARLREVDRARIERLLAERPPDITAFAGGLLLANADLDPVGEAVAPFFARTCSRAFGADRPT